MASFAASANPVDGTVSAGNATIGAAGNTLTVNQTSDKAVIDWRGFDIGSGEATRFNQPSSSSIALNRVNSGSASHIDGNLSANGNIIIINQNGVVFGVGSRVDVNGLVATTANVSNDKFMNTSGAIVFDEPGNPNAAIINRGTITAKDAGLVGLVAPRVINSGVITAKLGYVGLASGDTATVDFYGDGLLEVALSDQVAKQLVKNSGAIEADGGKISLTAASGRQVVDSLINNTGLLNAQTIGQHKGTIIIDDASAGGRIRHDGTISVVGNENGATGGSVTLVADTVALGAHSKIDASGNAGGGEIKVGGGAHGQGTSRNAKVTVVAKGAMLAADAAGNGGGGAVVVWSDRYTDFEGGLSAQGGAVGGDGGFAEVSGKQLLNFDGSVNLLAAHGATGSLLLDPYDVTIQVNAGGSNVTCTAGICTPSGTSSVLTVANLQAALASSNVEINTGTGGADTGNITVADSISWSTSNRLTLDAYKNIIINPGVTISNSYAGVTTGATLPVFLVLRADATSINNGGSVTNSGTIDFSGSTGAVSIFVDNATYGGTGYTNNGSVLMNGSWAAPTNASISSQVTAYNLVNNVTDLTAIANDLTANYALGKNINGGGAAFNANVPLGGGVAVPVYFSGILDGQYCALTGGSSCAVTGLTLAPTYVYGAGTSTGGGLFYGNSGLMRNFILGLDVTQNYSDANNNFWTGSLVGLNGGTIANVTTTGNVTVSYTNLSGASNSYVGGMVGLNSSIGIMINDSSQGTLNFTSQYSGNGTSSATIGIGGLAGDNTSGGQISNSSSSVNVTYTYQDSNLTPTITNTYVIGGLVGANFTTSQITNSSATGAVLAQYANGYSSGKATIDIGGLVGQSSANITNAWASGSVTDQIGGGSQFVGGLVGLQSTGTGVISGSYATGAVTASMLLSSNTNVYVGGLAGQLNTASASNVYATGNVSSTYAGTATQYVGGLIGNLSASTLSGASSYNGTVTATMQNSGTINANSHVGGLVGLQGATATIANGWSSENVNFIYQGASASVTNNANVGGLVGFASNTSGTYAITGTSYATGNVTAQMGASYSGAINGYVGGLIGQLGSNLISGLYATGNVTDSMSSGYNSTSGANLGVQYTGGLVGYMSATGGGVANAYATGAVTYQGLNIARVGGLVGMVNAGTTVSGSRATGNVSNTFTGATASSLASYTGGLVGFNQGAIDTSYARDGAVTATDMNSSAFNLSMPMGGFVGGASTGSTITTSYSTENVTYIYAGTSTVTNNAQIGGFIGSNSSNSAISQSYATGNVLGMYYSGLYSSGLVQGFLGGFVGQNGSTGNASTITTSFALGNVTSYLSGSSESIGGFVGNNSGTATISISDSYAMGNVNYQGTKTGASVGGFMGSLATNVNNVTRVYSTGSATNRVGSAGGLVGTIGGGGIVTDSYWDITSSGRATGVVSGGSGSTYTGLTTAQLQTALQTNFTNPTWAIVAGMSYPYLQWQFPSGTPQVVAGYAYADPSRTAYYSGGVIRAYVDGNFTGTTNRYAGLANPSTYNGYYYFLMAPNTISGSGSNVAIEIPATNTSFTGATLVENVTGSSNYLVGGAGTLANINLFDVFNNELNLSSLVGGETIAGALGKIPNATSQYSVAGSTITITNGLSLLLPVTQESALMSGITLNMSAGTASAAGSLHLVDYNSSGLTLASSNPSNGTTWLSSADVQSFLGRESVIVEALGGPLIVGSGSTISWSTSNLLALDANNNVTNNGTLTNTYSGTFGSTAIPVVLVLRADMNGGLTNASVTNSATGTINFASSTGGISIFYDKASGTYTNSGTVSTNGSWVAPTNQTINTQLTSYKLINAISDLTSITLSSTYAVGKNILGGYTTFNSNTPLGAFTGILDGQYCALMGGAACGISQYTISVSSSTTSAGIFSSSSGKIRNATLGFDLTGNYTGSSATKYGSVVGSSTGVITNVISLGNVNYTFSGATGCTNCIYVGGLVGSATAGSILNSTALGDVTVNYSGTATTGTIAAGGMVGNATATFLGDKSSGKVLVQYGSGSVVLSDKIYAGGLIGIANSGNSITNSSSSSSVVNSVNGLYSAIGGLVGANLDVLSGSHATGSVLNTVSTLGYVGGLVGRNYAAISNSDSQGGTVTAISNATGSGTDTQNIGGLVGQNNTAGTLTNVFSTEAVTYNYQDNSTGASTALIGGLVGYNISTASASISGASYATGNVLAQYSVGYSGNGEVHIGGLIGQNGNSTATSFAGTSGVPIYATGTVTNYVGGGSVQYVGGLIGLNQSSGATAYTYATGAVSYYGESDAHVGGLIGEIITSGTLDQSWSTGNVTVVYSGATGRIIRVGGLVGAMTGGDITNSYAKTGAVNVTDGGTGSAASTYRFGGLVGSRSGGSISNSYSAENITYTYKGTSSGAQSLLMGGLVGTENSVVTNAISGSYASGNVTAQYFAGYSGNVVGNVGGLVGRMGNDTAVNLTNDYATGAVSSSLVSSTDFQYIGGLIGHSYSSGTVTASYATGGVTYTGNSDAYVGGFVGLSDGVSGSNAITDSYAMGSVISTSGTSNSRIGGFVGGNGASATIARAYSTGAVSAAAGTVGGFVGNNAGTIQYSYWDTVTSGITAGSITDSMVGLTTAQLQAGLQPHFGSPDTTAWAILAGSSYPYLSALVTGTPQVIAGTVYNSAAGSTPVAGATVAALINGTSYGSASTGATGYYYFLLPSNTISVGGSEVLTYLTGNTKGQSFQDNATGSLTGFNVYASNLTVTSTGASLSTILSDLATAQGANTGANFTYTNNPASSLTLSSGYGAIFNLNAATTSIDRSINLPSGNLVINSTGSVSGSQPITASGLLLTGAGGNYSFTNSNNAISVLSANTGTVNLNDGSTTLSIGSINGTNGVTANSFYLADTAVVTQSQGINASNLLLTGTGGIFTLNNGANAVANLAGNANSISLNNGDNNLLITSLNGVNGITNTGTTTFTVGNATVTSTQAINTPLLALNGTAASFLFTNANNRVASLSANVKTVSFVDSIGLNFGGVTATNFYLNGTGTITQTAPIQIVNMALQGPNTTYLLTNNQNNIGTLAANAWSLNIATAGDVTIGSVNGINGITAADSVSLAIQGTMTLQQAVWAGGNGTNILISARVFNNAAGGNGLNSGGNGRWLVYTLTKSYNNPGGIGARFELSPCSYAGSCTGTIGDGNGFLYSLSQFNALPNTVQLVSQDPWKNAAAQSTPETTTMTMNDLLPMAHAIYSRQTVTRAEALDENKTLLVDPVLAEFFDVDQQQIEF